MTKNGGGGRLGRSRGSGSGNPRQRQHVGKGEAEDGGTDCVLGGGLGFPEWRWQAARAARWRCALARDFSVPGLCERGKRVRGHGRPMGIG
jgi:hypothetical protein